jgi:hypothetical protein
MIKTSIAIIVCLTTIWLAACAPTPQDIETAIAQTQKANPTRIPINTITSTSLPTYTSEPTTTPSLTNTSGPSPIPTRTIVPTATSFRGNMESALTAQGFTCKGSLCTESAATITISGHTLTIVIDATVENGAAADREYKHIEYALNMLYVPSLAQFFAQDIQIALDQSYNSSSPTTYFTDSIDNCPLSITIHWNQDNTVMTTITIILTIVE